jgi:hypothetical protein
MKPSDPKHCITITAEAAAAIRAAAIGEFRETGTHNPDGSWTVPIDSDVLSHLEMLSSLWGLSFSDVILRGLKHGPTDGNLQ